MTVTPLITPEFDCKECGRHIIRLVGDTRNPHTCAHCIYTPGWHKNPELRRIFDPEMEGPP